ncbi:hypothetical protein CFII64_14755 [Pseudomonas sp. CFII64]|uniref:antibiotic biosynthesis monooxygenase n=1 Tax=Pseudomonas sp. CFII64 TaxID=911242 RepID=UPI0003575FE2|nr:antibiotic biosynthesis monooxygenase [Pseudomonas sp. CFII64]EPJ84324.1 hypothetical protein CFII64_14755 [Pseudomonas sp. CFII64]
MTQPVSHRLVNQLIEFTTDSRQQSALVAALLDQVERFTCTYPGFISATVQASDDGQRVLNQVLWQSRTASEEALRNAEQDFTAFLCEHRVTAVNFNAYQVLGRVTPTR